jgi:hypothetical protein
VWAWPLLIFSIVQNLYNNSTAETNSSRAEMPTQDAGRG